MKAQSLYFAGITTFLLASCGNPGGIPDEQYAKYKELGAPKILYLCSEAQSLIKKLSDACPGISATPTESDLACIKKAQKRYIDPNEKMPTVGYAAGIGSEATYNHILNKAKIECHGDFKILEYKQ